MKFRKLKIINFKCYSSFECEFSDGLNLVYGANESGKTTLYQALVLSLFGPHPSNRKHFQNLYRDDFTRLGCDSKPVLELDFMHKGKLYSVKRDFNESKVLIASDVSNDDKQFEKFQINQAREFISDMFGGIEEEIFTKYASINHVDLASLDSASYLKENEEMGRSLVKLVESRSGADILEVKKTLGKELKSTSDELLSIGFEIDRMSTDLAEVKKRESELASLKSDESEKASTIEVLTKSKNEIDFIVKGMMERRNKGNQVKDLLAEIDKTENEYSRYRRAKSSIENLGEQIKKYPLAIRENRDKIYSELKETRERLMVLKAQQKQLTTQLKDRMSIFENENKRIAVEFGKIKEGHDDVVRFKEKDNELKSEEEKIREIDYRLEVMKDQLAESERRKKQMTLAGWTISIIGIIVIFTLMITLHNKLAAFLIPFLLFGIVAAIAFVIASKAVDPDKLSEKMASEDSLKKLKAKAADLISIKTQLSNKLGLTSREELDNKYNAYRETEGEVNTLKKVISELERDLNENRQSVQNEEDKQLELLKTTGYHTVDDLEDAIREYDDIQNAIKNKLTDFEYENVEKRMEELERKIASDRIMLKKLEDEIRDNYATEPLSEDEFLSRQNELNRLSDELSRVEKNRSDLVMRIEYLSDAIVESYEIAEEKLDRVYSAQKLRTEKREELEFLKEKIDELSSSYESEFLPKLEKRARELFREFAGTSNKDFTLESWPRITISSKELEGFGERHLSQGTRDQLYFALRIAWSDLLSPPDLKLPLIWDDPFVYCDETRTIGACEIALKLVELGHQLVVFTHRKDLVRQFEKMFETLEIQKFNLSQ
jgi:exonuclease SbcC